MQPISEYGRGATYGYGKIGKHGQVPYGRGLAQLSLDSGYEKADRELGLNGQLIADYDLALRPEIARAILFRGMMEGWFRNRKLSDYFNQTKTDWVGARDIVNSKDDRAVPIANHAKAFHRALILGLLGYNPEQPAARSLLTEEKITGSKSAPLSPPNLPRKVDSTPGWPNERSLAHGGESGDTKAADTRLAEIREIRSNDHHRSWRDKAMQAEELALIADELERKRRRGSVGVA